ncbi:MAG: hypothetical protein WCP91_03825, partial [Candidatus Berkelbacteria bacterium]
MISKLLLRLVSVIKIVIVIPMRVFDIAGWTDTHFAEHGVVQGMSVFSRLFGSNHHYLGVRVELTARLAKSGPGTFHLVAPDIGIDSVFIPGVTQLDSKDLLQAALRAVGLPSGLDVTVELSSHDVPPGASMGTSASAVVGLVAALEYLRRGEIDANWLARKAHEVETQEVGVECGVQDQGTVAHALGATMVDVYRYPAFNVSGIPLSQDTQERFEDSALTVVYGLPHRSGNVHLMVIKRIKRYGHLFPGLEALRVLPAEARFCLLSGDIANYAAVGIRNTECQRKLHRKLISPECQMLIDIAQTNLAWGWKVNGAGGPDGGSLTIMSGGLGKEAMAEAIRKQFPDAVILEHKLATGGLQPRVT